MRLYGVVTGPGGTYTGPFTSKMGPIRVTSYDDGLGVEVLLELRGNGQSYKDG